MLKFQSWWDGKQVWNVMFGDIGALGTLGYPMPDWLMV